MPRSGSSLTASLFAAHGVWVGSYRTGGANPLGFFENEPLKAFFKKEFGPLVNECREAPAGDYRDRIEQIIIADGYDGGPWLFKTSPLYRNCFAGFRPWVVKVRRPREQIIRSNISSRMVAHGYLVDVERIVDHHIALLDDMAGVDVFTDEVVSGDYTSLYRAFDYCGIPLRRSVVERTIRPELWNRT